MGLGSQPEAGGHKIESLTLRYLARALAGVAIGGVVAGAMRGYHKLRPPHKLFIPEDDGWRDLELEASPQVAVIPGELKEPVEGKPIEMSELTAAESDRDIA